MKENKNKQQPETFLSQELIDETQVQIPLGYKIINKYPLLPPFSYVNIIYNEEKASYLYFVDELRLNSQEKQIFDNLYRLLEESLESPTEKTANSTFEEHLDAILKDNEKFFQANSNASLEKVKYYLRRDVSGFGIIDPLMHDINIEDISCSGTDKPIYVWHRNYDSIPTNIRFGSEEKLNSFVSRIVFRAGKHVSAAFPIADLALQGNHRISVLYQKEITPKGSSFTIRKFKEDPYTVIDLIKFGTINLEIAAYLWMLVEAKMSFIVIGPTGSGKTTILNAITGLVHPDYKIFSVEDVAEININHENWFTLISRTGFGLEGEGEIGLYALLKSGMRHRPDYIAVGEIRGEEAYVMFQAMATGHAGLCTMHADGLESAIKRLQQKPMDIPPAYVSLMNCALVVKRVRESSTGQSSRRVIVVSEIVSSSSFHNAFSWSPRGDHFVDDLRESVLFKRIAESTGKELGEVLEEYRKRISILKWMLEQDIRDYKKVSDIIGKHYRDPKSLLAQMDLGA
ncbi:MAG: secretion system protein E [Thaumarchaeota archaeon 13_1_40CM_2_39_13_2]|nr:MAG: secretion system protein E [Thaumarchaeota archaeon 13_1_40CM_2_39_13_2]OLE45344.1 MAG: secretion system protein E [Thaumarchaeota archaeon 13_1_20CM_2_39_11]